MGITSFMPREWIGVEGHVFFVSERNPITDTRHNGQQRDLFPFLRFGIVSDEEGVVAENSWGLHHLCPVNGLGWMGFVLDISQNPP